VSATTQTSPSRALEQREAVAEAQAAVAKLREDDQQVFLLRVAGELSYEGVASALAIPVGTAKTRMRRALQQLRMALGVPVTKENLR
jgi:RNA polymerase sigma-70 factor (ECF subfamily)